MSRAKNQKGKSKVSVSEAASRVVVPVYHTGQGQDERARTRPPHLLRGLDSAWSIGSNPHRESGTRWRAAADVGATGPAAGPARGRQKGRDGNRLGDSVGAQAPCTGEGLRSAERAQRGMMERGDLDSGDVLAGRVSVPRRFKGRGLIAGLAHPHGRDDAHPDVGPGFLLRTQPGELLQGIAQGLEAGKALVDLSILAADLRAPATSQPEPG